MEQVIFLLSLSRKNRMFNRDISDIGASGYTCFSGKFGTEDDD